MGVKISARNGQVIVTGQQQDVKAAADVIDRLQQRLEERGAIEESDIDELLQQAAHSIAPKLDDPLIVYSHKKIVEPFTKGQSDYIKTMRKNDLTSVWKP